LEMEVHDREESETGFLRDEECCISILETIILIRGMKISGNWIIVGKILRVYSRSEKR